MTPIPSLLLAGAFVFPAPAASPLGDLELPWIFGDHMVLQRDSPIRVFGEATPGAEVRVTFAEETCADMASDSGHWQVQLGALEASSEGRTLLVETDGEKRRFVDVVVGEVWLCAGQSNMDFPLRRATESEAADDVDPGTTLLRFFDRSGSTPLSPVAYGEESLDALRAGRFFTGVWSVPSPSIAADFSAVGFFFGRSLEDALHVPIGLIDVSVGGSSTEGWISRDRLAAEPELAPLTHDFLSTDLTHPFIRERASKHLEAWFQGGRRGPRPPHPFEPGFLHEQAIASLAPFSIRGVAWYQGESNAHRPKLAGRLFSILIDEWRSAFARDDLPFYFAQLPGLNRSTWPEFRDMQSRVAARAHVGMAVTIDMGHPTDVHPPDKQAVGRRLAALALARTYGKETPWSGPTLEAARNNGRELTLSFHHGDGLAFAAGRGATGFEVAGKRRRYYPATAEIRGTTLALSSPEVDHPTSARYAWAPDPEWSLVNGAGLPAGPFREQDWDPVRIACIGDSITAGFGLGAPGKESYPAVLRAILGDGYDVRNFGHAGAGVIESTMRGSWRRGFRFQEEHAEALRYGPDILISNLGINDIMSWGESRGEFEGDYAALLADYAKGSTPPKRLLWTPLSPLFPGHAFHGSADEKEIHGAIRRVAQSQGAKAVDVSKSVARAAASFPDHIHPNAAGAAALAEAVFAALREASWITPSPPELRLYVVLRGGNQSGGAPGDSHALGRSTHPADGAVQLYRAAPHDGGMDVGWTQLVPDGAHPDRSGTEVGLGRMLFAAGERDFAIVSVSLPRGDLPAADQDNGWPLGAQRVEAAVRKAIEALPGSTVVHVAALHCALDHGWVPDLADRLRNSFKEARALVLLWGVSADASAVLPAAPSSPRAHGDRHTVRFQLHDFDLQRLGWEALPHGAPMVLGRRFAQAWLSLGGAPSWRRSNH